MLLIFDLDGTLIDSTRDLELSVNATRAHFRLPPLAPALIHSYVGNGAGVLVRRAMGPDAPDEQVDEAHRFFLKFYRAHALEHTKLYPGISDALSGLSEEGHHLAVLTNKPYKISFDILQGLDASQYFFRVYGGDSLPLKKPDPVGILQLMKEANQTKEDTLMIGDSSVDVFTARNAGVRVCGVLWGIQPESFAAHPPDFTIRQADELLQISPAFLLGSSQERF